MSSSVTDKPKIVYLTAGAGGMYCGSCIRDNFLVEGLEQLGWDTLLLPLYTPVRVDGHDHTVDQVFFGGINVYLQQKIPFFRHVPRILDRWLDNPKLIRRVASRSMTVSAAELGSLTLSMAKGEDGFQKKEVQRLVDWLKEVVKPELVCFTNLLVAGCLPAIQRELGIPAFVTLQGDDVFLDELREPWREQVMEEMRKLAASADGFLTFSPQYRDRMADMLAIPEEKFHLTPLGIPAADFDGVAEARSRRKPGQTIGYFARLAPEKGFDVLVDAFLELAPRFPESRLKVAGWLSDKDKGFHAAQLAKIEAAGLGDRFEHVEAPGDEEKHDFLASIDVFSVPARFVEPKGLYVLEAMACSLPVVVPDRGIFPELAAKSDAVVLCDPENPPDLAAKLGEVLKHPAITSEMAEKGRTWVSEHATLEAMARETARVFEASLGGGPNRVGSVNIPS